MGQIYYGEQENLKGKFHNVRAMSVREKRTGQKGGGKRN